MVDAEYYQDQLTRIKRDPAYTSTLKVMGGAGGGQTNWMNLNEISAQVLVDWLTNTYLSKKSKNHGKPHRRQS
jgi:hypothetical protein